MAWRSRSGQWSSAFSLMDIARSPHQVSEAEIILTHALPLSCANSRASWRRCAREDKLLRDASSPNAKVVNFDAELADVKVSAFEKWRLRQRAELGEALGARRRALRSGAKPRSCRQGAGDAAAPIEAVVGAAQAAVDDAADA